MEEKEFGLTMFERITIVGQCLPSESNIEFIRTSKWIREQLEYTMQEEEDYGFHIAEVGGKQVLAWDEVKAADEKTFTLPERAVKLIRQGLKSLSDQDKLTEQHLTLWEKFEMDDFGK